MKTKKGPATPGESVEEDTPANFGEVTAGTGPEAEAIPFPANAGVRPAPAEAEIRAQEYLDQLQRLKAEFDNYRRRTAKERDDWFTQAQAEVIEALLPVLDDLYRAREHEAADVAAEPQGTRLILKRLEDTLERLGLEKQQADVGAEFDPDLHDAMMTEPSSEIPEGMIVRVVESGYLFRGRLLRRSRICYSTGPAGE